MLKILCKIIYYVHVIILFNHVFFSFLNNYSNNFQSTNNIYLDITNYIFYYYQLNLKFHCNNLLYYVNLPDLSTHSNVINNPLFYVFNIFNII